MIIQTENEVKHLWRTADCVCFDVDSTVCKNEAIDDLAEFCGVGEHVQRITLEAMGGNLSFREALRKRLNIIQPSAAIIEEFNKIQKCQLTPGIIDLIEMLHERKVNVFLVSGGFRKIINPVADILKIDRQNVYANTILFKENGEYDGFNENELTSESGGKGKVIELIRKKHGFKNIIMIGDGMTDFESCPPANAFIGFGGNIIREKVKKHSAWFATNFQQLIHEISNKENIINIV